MSSSSLTQLSGKSPLCLFFIISNVFQSFINVAKVLFEGSLIVCVFSVFQLEGKVQQGERDFEQISKTIRKEVSRFEVRTIDRWVFARSKNP